MAIDRSTVISWGRRVSPTASLVALTLFAYANSFDASFQFDDDHVIQNNLGIRGFGAFWDHLAFQLNRPLLFLSFTVNYELGGLDPWGYHVGNLLLHGLNSALVALLAKTVLTLGMDGEGRAARRAAFLAAAFFALHPTSTEAVTYISSRSSLLVTAAYLTGSIAASRSVMRSGTESLLWRWFSLLAFLAAMATKELALSFPFVLLFLLWVLPWPSRSGISVREGIRLVVPFVGLLLAAMSIRVLMGPLRAPFVTWSLSTHLSTQAASWVTYPTLVFFPAGLNVDHDVPLAQHFGLEQWGGIGLLVAMLAVVVGARRRWPWASFALGWFLLTLAPTSLIPLQDHVAERRLYLPLAGLSVGIGQLLVGLGSSPRLRGGGWILVAVLLIGLATATHLRNRAWATPVTLWSDAARKSPSKARPQARLGRAYAELGDSSSALRHMDRALRLDPEDLFARRDRAALLRSLGRFEEAERDAIVLTRLQPEDSGSWQELAELALVRGQPTRALEILRPNELRDPLDRATFLTQAQAHLALGEPGEARRALLRSTRRWPGDAAGHLALARLEIQLGRLDAARESLARVGESEATNGELEELSKLLAHREREESQP